MGVKKTVRLCRVPPIETEPLTWITEDEDEDEEMEDDEYMYDQDRPSEYS